MTAREFPPAGFEAATTAVSAKALRSSSELLLTQFPADVRASFQRCVRGSAAATHRGLAAACPRLTRAAPTHLYARSSTCHGSQALS